MTQQKLYFLYGMPSDLISRLQASGKHPQWSGSYLGCGYISDYETIISDNRLSIRHRPGAQVWGSVIALSDEEINVLEAHKEGLKGYSRYSVEVEVQVHNEKPPAFMQANVHIADNVPSFRESISKRFSWVKTFFNLNRRL